MTQGISNINLTTEKQVFSMPRKDWVMSTLYLLMMALYGLDFYPAILVIAVLLLRSFNNNRYEFLIQLTLLFGCYGLTDTNRNYPIKAEDIALAISVIGIFIYKKNVLTRRILTIMLLYIVAVFLISLTSEEVMGIQIRRMRTYFAILYLFVPLLVFANRQFEIDKFFRQLLMYSIIICVFYTIDGFILCGHFFMPNTFIWGSAMSKFYDPVWAPFSMNFVRKYPPGLYLLALCVYPIARYYKLQKWQILFIVLALLACRTMTVIAGLLVAYIMVIGKIKLFFKYVSIAIAGLVVLYFVDRGLGGFMRVSSTVDQFTNFAMPEEQIDGLQDENEVSFGSGRLAQIVPKFELLYSLNREWLGFGFLHPTETTNQKYIILNPFYQDLASAEEVATDVEVTQAQTILDIGYIGLIIQTLFFLSLYLIIKKLEFSTYFFSLLVCFFISGFGGFGGYIFPASLFLITISLSVVILINKNKSLNA